MPFSTNSTETVDDYNFEKQRQDALKQFDKLYANLKNNSDNKKEKKSENPQNKIRAKFKKSKVKNLTDIFFKDQDKTLIILLIIMLMDNEENLIIIMALFYLLI